MNDNFSLHSRGLWQRMVCVRCASVCVSVWVAREAYAQAKQRYFKQTDLNPHSGLMPLAQRSNGTATMTMATTKRHLVTFGAHHSSVSVCHSPISPHQAFASFHWPCSCRAVPGLHITINAISAMRKCIERIGWLD